MNDELNDEKKFLNLPGLKQYHKDLQKYINSIIPSSNSEYVGYSDDVTYEPLEEDEVV